ncbi:MAG: acyl carrier protein [Gemmatimonadota bacterium]|jgi:acyl carrier protein
MASYDECLQIIRELAEPFADEGVTIEEESVLGAELGLSSLRTLELVADLEDRLDVSLPLNALPGVRTVGELARLLEKASGGKDG